MNDYPGNWEEIRWEMYEWADYRCEHCHMAFVTASTIAQNAKRKDGRPFILTVHHLDGDKANCEFGNLLVCCQRCHLHIQAVWKPGGMIQPSWAHLRCANADGVPGWIIKRKLPYVLPPYQLRLF